MQHFKGRRSRLAASAMLCIHTYVALAKSKNFQNYLIGQMTKYLLERVDLQAFLMLVATGVCRSWTLPSARLHLLQSSNACYVRSSICLAAIYEEAQSALLQKRMKLA